MQLQQVTDKSPLATPRLDVPGISVQTGDSFTKQRIKIRLSVIAR